MPDDHLTLRPTELEQAKHFALELFRRLEEDLGDVERVRQTVARLEPLARAFPETRFCKGCVLPVVDRWANEFLRGRWNASPGGVYRALRCEGFANLDDYYPKAGVLTHCSGFTQVRTAQPGSKCGMKRSSRPSPDFCIRYRGRTGALRMVGEVKYLSRKEAAEPSVVGQVLRELAYYLAIPAGADPRTVWGHDFGFGIVYAAGGSGPRRGRLVDTDWDSHQVLIAVFDAAGG